MSASVPTAPIVGLLPHRACQNCVQVKVKCMPQESANNTVCQRCFRLKKTCTTSRPAIRKRRRVGTPRIAQLEDRINELSALVNPTNAVPVPVVHNLTPTESPASLPFSGRKDEHESPLRISPRPMHDQNQKLGFPHGMERGLSACCAPESPSATDEEPSTIMLYEVDPDVFQEYPTSDSRLNLHSATNNHVPSISPTYKSCTSSVDFCPIFLDPTLELTLLDGFRKNLSPSFPFVVLDSAATVSTMKRHHPFLFWACIAAASQPNPQLHKRLVEEMLKGIGEHTFTKGTKSLDLLQGILIMIAWYHFYAHTTPQLMNLLHLANALVVDLGLNRPSYSQDRIKLVMESAELIHGRRVVSGLKTSDERRALLGCYFLTSKMSLCFTRVDPMRYSRHIHECCQQLESTAEFETDILVVHLVRAHYITGKYIQDDFVTSSVPTRVYSTMFRNESERFQQNLPPALRASAVFQAEVRGCTVCLYEPSQFTNCEGSLDRIELLHSCMAALGEYFETFAAIPPEQSAYAALPAWISLMHCLTVSARLCFLDLDGWDKNYARNKLDFVSIIQSVIDKFLAIFAHNQATNIEKAAWKFSLYAEKMKKVKYWYEAKIGAEEKLVATANDEFNPGEIPGAFDASLFDCNFDDAFWSDMLGDWMSF